jgi:hypothetical protein
VSISLIEMLVSFYTLIRERASTGSVGGFYENRYFSRSKLTTIQSPVPSVVGLQLLTRKTNENKDLAKKKPTRLSSLASTSQLL